MAETIEFLCTANGQEIAGEPTQLLAGRSANAIEVFQFRHAGRAKREEGSGMPTGRRAWQPIVIRKRIDKATPLLAKALANNEAIEGTFKFYRPSPSGDGTTEQFYTIRIQRAAVDSIEQILPDTFNPTNTSMPPVEEITFVFGSITWTYTPTGASHTDSWK